MSTNNESKINYGVYTPVTATDIPEKSDKEDEAAGESDILPGPSRLCCSCCKGCWSLGCCWGIVACLYFFIIIPTGVLLIIYGHTKSVPLALALGLVLLFVFTCGIPGVYIGVHYRRVRQKLNLDLLRSRAAHMSKRNSEQNASLTRNIVDADDCVLPMPLERSSTEDLSRV